MTGLGVMSVIGSVGVGVRRNGLYHAHEPLGTADRIAAASMIFVGTNGVSYHVLGNGGRGGER